MPRYFFDLYEEQPVPDQEGETFSSLEAATIAAFGVARSLVADQALRGTISLSHRIEITDESGRVLETIIFRDAVAVKP